MEKRTKNGLVFGSILGVGGFSIIALTLGSLMSQGDESEDVKIVEPEEIVTPEIDPDDPREVFDSSLAGPNQSIVMLTHSGRRCTATDLGNGFAITAAHCFSDRMIYIDTTRPQPKLPGTSILYGCEAGDDGLNECMFAFDVQEVALPKQYGRNPNLTNRAFDNKRGYDIAFIKYTPLYDGFSLSHYFPLHVGVNAQEPLTQKGFSGDRPGLTGETCQVVADESENAEYVVQAGCYVVGGDSGSPFFNKNSEIVGIASSGNEEIGKSDFTPITPELLRTFERFKSATLDGEIVDLQNGTPAILFDYDRMPTKYEGGLPAPEQP